MAAAPARILMAFVAIGLSYLAWAGYVSKPTLLERVRDEGELIVLTRVSPSTYFEAQNGPAGLEYDLVTLFAEDLGVEAKLITASSTSEILSSLALRQAHFAAAGLSITPERAKRFRFTDPYMDVQQQLVYRSGDRRPRALSELEPGSLLVLANSSHSEILEQLRAEHGELDWAETSEHSAEDLLYQVWKQQIRYTIADSNDLILHQRFYPEIRAALDVSEPLGLAWAFPNDDDDSLFRAANEFFERIRNDGTLDHLIEKYYGHLGSFDYVGTRTYLRHLTERLPLYRETFEKAGEATGIDWRLLAAVGYQESHWDPAAVSPTGVRGIMMLTLNTASSLGVTDRQNPTQSIFGGARYLAQVKKRIPEHIPEPTRTWLALAAYNVGYGHLEDARQITEQLGGDPDNWLDVKKSLPLLSQAKWYKKTRYGYARGWEPVRYVENIRIYYDMLIRVTEPELLMTPNDGSGLSIDRDSKSVFMNSFVESAL